MTSFLRVPKLGFPKTDFSSASLMPAKTSLSISSFCTRAAIAAADSVGMRSRINRESSDDDNDDEDDNYENEQNQPPTSLWSRVAK